LILLSTEHYKFLLFFTYLAKILLPSAPSGILKPHQFKSQMPSSI